MEEERLVNRGSTGSLAEREMRWRTREEAFDCGLLSLGRKVKTRIQVF